MERRVVWIENLGTEKVRERQIGSFWNVDLTKYGEYQLERSKNAGMRQFYFVLFYLFCFFYWITNQNKNSVQSRYFEISYWIWRFTKIKVSRFQDLFFFSRHDCDLFTKDNTYKTLKNKQNKIKHKQNISKQNKSKQKKQNN